ncbi:MAG: hypothetical protein NTV33_03765 [Coprothermobacterota bacterium]|nr:hypothetical protein [Coprothermobacterota bacterium]
MSKQAGGYSALNSLRQHVTGHPAGGYRAAGGYSALNSLRQHV